MTETELKKFTTRTCGQDLDKGSIILLLFLFALTNRGVIATFTNLPEFINDIKNEYKK